MDENFENNRVSEVIADEKKSDLRSVTMNIFGWIDDLVTYFVVFILIMSFVFRPVIVNGSSMIHTLYNGDILVLRNILYTPDYGDIVVISREDNLDRPLVKRVIALGGDVVDIDTSTHTVYINGEAIVEDYVYIDPNYNISNIYGKIEYPYTVPEDCVFVMGDNRLNSTDSTDVGAIECGQVLGKAICRVYRDTEKYGGSMFELFE